MDSDSQVAISLLLGEVDRVHPCAALVHRIKAFEQIGGVFVWNHTLQEANQVVDILAKYGLRHAEQDHIFSVVPSFLSLPFMADVALTFSPCGY